MSRARGNNSTPRRCDARRRLSFNESDDGGPSEFRRRAPINQSYTIQRGTVSPAQNVRCAPNLGETYDRTFANYSDVGPSDITHGTYSVVYPEVCLQDDTYNEFASGLQSDLRSTPRSRPQQSICRVLNSTFAQPRDVCPLPASQRSSQSPQAQITPPYGRICPQSPTSYSPQRFRPPLRRQQNFDFGDECDISRRERINVSRSNRSAASRSGNIPNFSLASSRNEPVVLDISHRMLENSISREPLSLDAVSISLLSNRDSLHADLNNINDILNDDDFVDDLIADLSQRSVDNSNRSNRPISPRNLPANRSFGRMRGQINLHDESNLEQRGQRRDFEDGLVGYRSPRANQRGQRRISEDGYRRGPRNLHDESDIEQRGRRNLHDESDLEDIPLCQRGLRRDLEDGFAMGNMSPRANQRGQRNLHDESYLEQRGQRRDNEDGLVGYRSPRANQRGQRNLHDESNLEQRGQRRDYEDGLVGYRSPRANQRGQRNLHDESNLEQRGQRRDFEDGLVGDMRNLHDQSDQEQGGARNLHDQSDQEQGGRRNLHDHSDQEQGGPRNLHDQSDLEQGGPRNLHDQSDLEQGGRRNLHDQSDLEQGGARNLHDQSDQEQGGRRNLHDQSDQEQGGPRNLHDQSDLEQGGPRNLHDQSDLEQGGRRNLHDQSDLEQGGRGNLHDQSDLEQGGRRNLHDQSALEQGGPRNLHDQSDFEQGGQRNLHDQSDMEQGGARNLHDQSDMEQGGPRNLHDESDLEDVPLCQRGLRRDEEDGLVAENVSPRANQRGRRNLHDESDLEGGRGRNMSPQRGRRNLNDSNLEDGFGRVPQGDQGHGNVSINARMYRVMSPAANQRRRRFEEQDEDGLVLRNRQLMSPQANQRPFRFEEPGPSGLARQNRQVCISPPVNQRRPRNIHPISPANQRSPRYIPENRLGNVLAFENADISEEMLDLMIEDLMEDISQQLNIQIAPENISMSPPRRAANMSLSPPRRAANMSLSPPRQARNIPASPPRQPVRCIPFPPSQARNIPPNRSLAQARSPPGNRAGPSRNEFPTNEQLISNLLRASANASGIAVPPPTGSPQRDLENLVAHGALDELTMSLVNVSLSEDIISGPNELLEHISELSFVNISTESGEQQISILNESIRPPQNVNMSSLLGESPRMLEDESPLCSLNQGGDEILRLESADEGPWRVAVQYSPDGEVSVEEYDAFQRVIEDLGERNQSPRSARTPPISSTPKKPRP